MRELFQTFLDAVEKAREAKTDVTVAEASIHRAIQPGFYMLDGTLIEVVRLIKRGEPEVRKIQVIGPVQSV